MKAREEMVRMGTKIGAALGGLVCMTFGLLPGFYFGSYGVLVVLKHLMGGPVDPTVLVRMIMAVGIVLGIVCIVTVSIVAGAIIGTALGYMVAALSSPAEAKEGTGELMETKVEPGEIGEEVHNPPSSKAIRGERQYWEYHRLEFAQKPSGIENNAV